MKMEEELVDLRALGVRLRDASEPLLVGPPHAKEIYRVFERPEETQFATGMTRAPKN